MSDRCMAISKFIDSTQWGDWSRAAIAQDASSRSYMRLSHGDQSVILMDAPPSTGEDVGPFVRISELLQGMGLAAPKILKQDQDNGFLILEDLGTADVAKTTDAVPETAQDIYRAAADVLIHIANQPAPKLHKMDAETAGNMVRIAAEHYVRSPTLADDLQHAVTDMVQSHCGPADTLALRDYHAENLIWRPKETGLQRIGLLDFQDAFIAPSGYDLASLLRDARRDIDPELAASIISHVAQNSQVPAAHWSMHVRCLALQRNLRILGVFGRLIHVHGKTRYAGMLPRVYRYIAEDLDHPALGHLRRLVSDGLPVPIALKFPEATS